MPKPVVKSMYHSSRLERGITVIQGDCRDIISGLGQFDFVFADPPFKIGQGYLDFSDGMSVPEYAKFSKERLGLIKTLK